MVPPNSPDDRSKAERAAIDRRYAMRSLCNSSIGAALFGLALVFGVIRLHAFVVARAAPNEIPGMAWVAMIFPGLAFLLAYVNFRAYRRAVSDPNYDLSRMYPREIRSPEELKAWLEQQRGGTKNGKP